MYRSTFLEGSRLVGPRLFRSISQLLVQRDCCCDLPLVWHVRGRQRTIFQLGYHFRICIETKEPDRNTVLFLSGVMELVEDVDYLLFTDGLGMRCICRFQCRLEVKGICRNLSRVHSCSATRPPSSPISAIAPHCLLGLTFPDVDLAQK